MSSVVIAGNTSGTVTLSAPDIAGTTVLSLPSTSGTLATLDTAGFPSGTRMSFNQTAAPTGWTKDTTAGLNDSIMRIVTGSVSSGGSNAFSTFNGQTSVGATTLSTAQMPSHSHSLSNSVYTDGGSSDALSEGSRGFVVINTNATGGGGSHTHTMTTAIKYNDFIIASKN